MVTIIYWIGRDLVVNISEIKKNKSGCFKSASNFRVRATAFEIHIFRGHVP